MLGPDVAREGERGGEDASRGLGPSNKVDGRLPGWIKEKGDKR